VAGHRDRTAVLDRHAENFGFAVGSQRQFVAERGAEDGCGGTAVGSRRFLSGIQLDVLVHAAALADEGIPVVFDVVDDPPELLVEPDIADHAVVGRVGSSG